VVQVRRVSNEVMLRRKMAISVDLILIYNAPAFYHAMNAVLGLEHDVLDDAKLCSGSRETMRYVGLMPSTFLANSGKRFDWTCHKFAFNCDKREARLARACVRESNLRETHLVRAKKGPPSLKRGRERSSEKQRVPEQKKRHKQHTQHQRHKQQPETPNTHPTRARQRHKHPEIIQANTRMQSNTASPESRMASLLEKTGKGMVCVGASSDKGKAADDNTAAERRNSKHAMLSHFSRVEVRAGEALLSLYDYFATAVLQMASSDPIHNHTRAHVHTHTPTHLSTDATRGAASEMGNTGLGKNVVHGVSLCVGGVKSVVVQHVLHDDALEEEDVVMEEEEHMVIEQKDVVEEECHDDEMDIRNAGDTSDDMATHMALQLLNSLFP